MFPAHLPLWSCWLQRNERGKSISPAEEQLKRSSGSCWAALQIDFSMLSGLIFHLHCYSVTLVILQKPRSPWEKGYFCDVWNPKSPGCVMRLHLLLRSFLFSLILLAAHRPGARSAFSSLEQENTSPQREERLLKHDLGDELTLVPAAVCWELMRRGCVEAESISYAVYILYIKI